MERFMKCNSEWLINDLVLPAVCITSANNDVHVNKPRGRLAKYFDRERDRALYEQNER